MKYQEVLCWEKRSKNDVLKYDMLPGEVQQRVQDMLSDVFQIVGLTERTCRSHGEDWIGQDRIRRD